MLMKKIYYYNYNIFPTSTVASQATLLISFHPNSKNDQSPTGSRLTISLISHCSMISIR